MRQNIGAIVECGQVPAGSSTKRQCLESESVRIGQRWREYFLTHSTEGYEPAGSMARWTGEYWSVTFELDGATHGRRFKTLTEAQKLFDLWTKPNDAEPLDAEGPDVHSLCR